MIDCPHISIAELSTAWKVSKRTVQRWLAEDGITPVKRGRYKVEDIERYAEKNGKRHPDSDELWEITRLRIEVDTLERRLKDINERMMEIARISVGGGINETAHDPRGTKDSRYLRGTPADGTV